jgi:hypothetical protein
MGTTVSCSGTTTKYRGARPQLEGNFFPIFCRRLRHVGAVKIPLFAGLLICQAASAAESLVEKYSAAGQLVLTQFVSAPFPHFSRTNGHKYKEEFFTAEQHYSDSTVALFIPKGFRQTARVDFIIHFHGWRNSVAGTLQNFDLIEQLLASGKNAILVVPEGPKNAPDSSGGQLEDETGFRRFMAEAMETLTARGVVKKDSTAGGIILSGHSGGYLVISSILERGGMSPQVKEVWLFDALYGQTEKFLAWAKPPEGRLVNIYTDNGGTKARTEEMMALLEQRGAGFLRTTDQAVSVPELKTNALVFLHTDLTHNDVVAKRKTFLQFLNTSFLESRKND